MPSRRSPPTRTRRAPKAERPPPAARRAPRSHQTKRVQRSNGKDVTNRAPEAQGEVQDPGLQSVPELRAPARLLPQVRTLPPLPAQGRSRGLRARDEQGELVARPTAIT